MIDNLTFIKRLGKGSFGEVFLTSKRGSTELFATKKMDRQYADSPGVRKYFVNEINILKEVNHKNIVKLDELKETKDHYYIVMEYCNGGSLTECLANYKKLHGGRPFTEEIVQYLMRQIVDAIQYLHNKKIIHRDLKLDNILVKFDNDMDKNRVNMMKAKVKIIDFGFAVHLSGKNMAFSALGSPINMDPIILKKLNKRGNANALGYDEKADIWSLGTLCYEMLIGQAVFNAQTMDDLVRKVERGSYVVPTSLSREVVSFLNGMLQYNSSLRFTANELAKHHFLVKKVSDFTHMDLGKAPGKVNNKGLNMNTRKNRSIWAVFNENEDKLINVPKNLGQLNKKETLKMQSPSRFRALTSPNADQKGNNQINQFPNNPYNYQLNNPQTMRRMTGMSPQLGRMNTMMPNNPMGGPMMIPSFGVPPPGPEIDPFSFNRGGVLPFNSGFQNNPPVYGPRPQIFEPEDSCKIF